MNLRLVLFVSSVLFIHCLLDFLLQKGWLCFLLEVFIFRFRSLIHMGFLLLLFSFLFSEIGSVAPTGLKIWDPPQPPKYWGSSGTIHYGAWPILGFSVRDPTLFSHFCQLLVHLSHWLQCHCHCHYTLLDVGVCYCFLSLLWIAVLGHCAFNEPR